MVLAATKRCPIWPHKMSSKTPHDQLFTATLKKCQKLPLLAAARQHNNALPDLKLSENHQKRHMPVANYKRRSITQYPSGAVLLLLLLLILLLLPAATAAAHAQNHKKKKKDSSEVLQIFSGSNAHHTSTKARRKVTLLNRASQRKPSDESPAL